MSPFATAHMFCASRDGPRKSGFLTVVPVKTQISFMVYNYTGKVDLGKDYWNLKRELGVKNYFISNNIPTNGMKF